MNIWCQHLKTIIRGKGWNLLFLLLSYCLMNQPTASSRSTAKYTCRMSHQYIRSCPKSGMQGVHWSSDIVMGFILFTNRVCINDEQNIFLQSLQVPNQLHWASIRLLRQRLNLADILSNPYSNTTGFDSGNNKEFFSFQVGTSNHIRLAFSVTVIKF